MVKTRLAVVALMSFAVVLPVFAKTYKSTYPVPCSEVRGVVKDACRTHGNSVR